MPAAGDTIKQSDLTYTHPLAIASTTFNKITRFAEPTTFEPIGEPLEHPNDIHCMVVSNDGLSRQSHSYMDNSSDSLHTVLVETIAGSKPHPACTGVPCVFFDNFDTHSSRQCNNCSVPTMLRCRVEGSRIKLNITRLSFLVSPLLKGVLRILAEAR
ncbi:hypothetical protein DFJ58DRAFT_726731 [Suillus subalutaceus]|uniref:uncharacterized protein n=1 Tax=Suillus subalutaceus TaxID=48586 RepID=UPI001B8665BD|nr:uncharacterized protein DFJ58DRAFT_726731 [Suillus subalutaceus]KAG1858022.1 hypothetical protein DFJ58DRAFT_726731 [Suillus subalutaceus]